MQKLKFARIWLVIGYIGVSLAIFASLVPPPEFLEEHFFLQDKLLHFGTYAILMGWFTQVFESKNYIFIGIGFISLGVILEIMQRFTFYRTMDMGDIVANCGGVFISWFIAKTFNQSLFAIIEEKFF